MLDAKNNKSDEDDPEPSQDGGEEQAKDPSEEDNGRDQAQWLEKGVGPWQ